MISLTMALAMLCSSKLIPILQVILNDCDDDIPLSEVKYKEELLAGLNEIYNPKVIAISFTTGSIFILDGRMNIFILKRGENKTQQIHTNDENIRSIAIDNNHSQGKLYIGSKTGFKVYDEINDPYVRDVDGINWEIWKIFIPRNSKELYAVSFPYGIAYKFNDVFSLGESLNYFIREWPTDRFLVDGQGNYFFNTGTHMQGSTQLKLKGDLEPSTYTKFMHVLGIDNNDRVFGMDGGLYYHMKLNDSVPELVNRLRFQPRYVTFDLNNNPVFLMYENNKVIRMRVDNEC